MKDMYMKGKEVTNASNEINDPWLQSWTFVQASTSL